jgi:phytoene/squalene synthetase
MSDARKLQPCGETTVLFMNTWDIDAAKQKHANHPLLAQATQLLSDLRDLADAVSDGWCYWKAPVRSANLLMQLIQNNGDPSKNDLKRAVAPIKAFMTREARQLKGNTLNFPV